MSSDPIIADSAADHLWRLVESLQREKEALRAESKMWQERFLAMTGMADQTSEPVSLSGGPLGKHVSIMGLRHKYEALARERAKKLKGEGDDAS
jgi:hypothetical protein